MRSCSFTWCSTKASGRSPLAALLQSGVHADGQVNQSIEAGGGFLGNHFILYGLCETIEKNVELSVYSIH